MLNARLAADLVDRLSTHIDFNINIMDDRGVIIASRDRNRVGDFHAAAYPTRPFGTGGFAKFIAFIGDPVTALMIGVFIALTLVRKDQLKTAQGSSTVAIITTASIMAPLLAPLGLNPALTVLAIGAGSMVVSHANDSCFRVVSKFSNMPVATSYKAYTTATFLEGVVAFIFVAILSIFIH